MSAEPMSGAASSAPSALSSTTCSKPCSLKNFRAMFWYPVTTRRGLVSVQSDMAFRSSRLLMFANLQEAAGMWVPFCGSLHKGMEGLRSWKACARATACWKAP